MNAIHFRLRNATAAPAAHWLLKKRACEAACRTRPIPGSSG